MKKQSIGLGLFPFFKNDPFPKDGDTSDIIEAKKLFIAYGIWDIGDFWKECTELQQNNLRKLTYFDSAFSHFKNIFYNYTIAVLEIKKEIQAKYGASNSVGSRGPK